MFELRRMPPVGRLSCLVVEDTASIPQPQGEIMTHRVSPFSVLLIVSALRMITGPIAVAEASTQFDLEKDSVEIRSDGQIVSVSLRSPVFTWDDGKIVGNASPLHTTGTLADGQTLEVSYAPIPIGNAANMEVKLFLRWSQPESVLRKWARVRFSGGQRSRLLKEVVLDRIDVQGRTVWTGRRAGKRPSRSAGPRKPAPFSCRVCSWAWNSPLRSTVVRKGG